jgi:hypothetical protein
MVVNIIDLVQKYTEMYTNLQECKIVTTHLYEVYTSFLKLSDEQNEKEVNRLREGIPFSQSTWQYKVHEDVIGAWNEYASNVQIYNNLWSEMAKFKNAADTLGISLPRFKNMKIMPRVDFCSTVAKYFTKDMQPCSYYEAHKDDPSSDDDCDDDDSIISGVDEWRWNETFTKRVFIS